MFNFITKWFTKKKPEQVQTTKQKLQEKTMVSKTIVVANKQPFYHEMIGNADGSRLVRIYNRKSGVVVKEELCPDKETAMQKSLEFMNEFNGGGTE